MKLPTLLLCLLLGFIAGVVGGIFVNQDSQFGATTARTTITNPWTFAATTTHNANINLTHTNAATSTLVVGCIETFATSTASPLHLEFSVASTTTGFPSGLAGNGLTSWKFGHCPKI